MPAAITIKRLTGAAKNKEEQFTVSELSFGSSPNSTVRFDPTWDRGISPSHARAYCDERGYWWLEDAGSNSGTWVHGRRITAKHPVSGSTVIELGKGGAKVELVPAAGAPEYARHDSGRRKSKVKVLLVLLLVMGGAAFGIFRLWQGSRPDSDELLKQAAETNASAVGVVMAVTPEGPRPFATAWAVKDNIFATNAHVVAGVSRAVAAGAEIYITINRQPQLRFRVIKADVHPRAFSNQLNVQGKSPAVPPWDVGLLYVEGKAPAIMRLAGPDKLKALGSGTRVAYLGFPMEGMISGGVNTSEPVANMQSGIVTSVSDFWLGAAAPEQCLLVSHNLGAAGGASGSPVFDADGEVVAVLSAGNITMSVEMEGNVPKVKRVPSAVMINFAQRADILAELLEKAASN